MILLHMLQLVLYSVPLALVRFMLLYAWWYVTGRGNVFVGPDGEPLPARLKVVAGGLLVGKNGRPLPHGIQIVGSTLVASTGEQLPDSMQFGPNR